MKKIGIVLSIIVLISVIFAGCSSASAEVAKPQPSEGAETFAPEGSCDAALNGGVLTVTGESNLMDGTNGIVSVLGFDGITLEEQKFTQQGGSVSFDFEVADDWPDTVYGYIAYSTQQGDKQPKEVTAVYGKKFENLDGPNVIWDLKGVVAIFQSDAVMIG